MAKVPSDENIKVPTETAHDLIEGHEASRRRRRRNFPLHLPLILYSPFSFKSTVIILCPHISFMIPAKLKSIQVHIPELCVEAFVSIIKIIINIAL